MSMYRIDAAFVCKSGQHALYTELNFLFWNKRRTQNINHLWQELPCGRGFPTTFIQEALPIFADVLALSF